jgi:hypothetical protein
LFADYQKRSIFAPQNKKGITISVCCFDYFFREIAQLVEHDLAPKEWILSGLGKRY